LARELTGSPVRMCSSTRAARIAALRSSNIMTRG
jgi:hypothetical protein